tara:strand:- start:680 stop:919 length:240 start_codon:yes stop_codon:yes gene_type:complete
MIRINKIYSYIDWDRRFLIIPNWTGTDKEFFHIIECVTQEENTNHRISKESMITGYDNKHNLNTLEDAEDFIINYINNK